MTSMDKRKKGPLKKSYYVYIVSWRQFDTGAREIIGGYTSAEKAREFGMERAIPAGMALDIERVKVR